MEKTKHNKPGINIFDNNFYFLIGPKCQSVILIVCDYWNAGNVVPQAKIPCICKIFQSTKAMHYGKGLRSTKNLNSKIHTRLPRRLHYNYKKPFNIFTKSFLKKSQKALLKVISLSCSYQICLHYF
jgi:hypothetical protein